MSCYPHMNYFHVVRTDLNKRPLSVPLYTSHGDFYKACAGAIVRRHMLMDGHERLLIVQVTADGEQLPTITDMTMPGSMDTNKTVQRYVKEWSFIEYHAKMEAGYRAAGRHQRG